MERLTIYVFGNPLVDEDSLPLKLIEKLRKIFHNIDFKEIDPSENLHKLGKNLYIIDSVIGIDKVEVIKDIESIELNKIYSVHDFDLGFNLKLMKNSGMLENVVIFGIPAQMGEEEALKQLEKVLKQFLNEKGIIL